VREHTRFEFDQTTRLAAIWLQAKETKVRRKKKGGRQGRTQGYLSNNWTKVKIERARLGLTYWGSESPSRIGLPVIVTSEIKKSTSRVPRTKTRGTNPVKT